MTDLIVISILLVMVGGAITYVYRAKKSGQTCIGCPHAKSCGRKACNCESQNKY